MSALAADSKTIIAARLRGLLVLVCLGRACKKSTGSLNGTPSANAAITTNAHPICASHAGCMDDRTRLIRVT